MKCTNPKCGVYNERGAKFCEKCGTPIKNQGRKGLFIFLGIIAALAVILLILWKTGVFPKKQTSKNINTTEIHSNVQAENPSQQQSTADISLRLHGSNTIGEKLSPLLARAFLEKRGTKNITETPTAPDEKKIQGTINGKTQEFEIKAHGSETAFTSLSEGKCDIGCASRQAKPEEVQQLKTANIGDMTSSGSEIVIAMDGIAVIVNPNNPIDKLSVEQIAQIFNGHVTDWSKINPGFSGAINVYARDDKSGTFDTFKNLVLKTQKDPATNKEYPLVTGAKRFESSEELSRQVVNDPRGIGFIGLPYILNSKAVSVYQENSTPLYPTAFTVETEDYILSRRLFFYIPAKPGPGAREFVDFVLSAEGQQIVEKVGFVPITIQLFPSHISPGAPLNYRNYVSGCKRLSINIRFKTDSKELDNKAVWDLNRLVDFLKAPEQRTAVIVLAGFADNTGTPDHNTVLSRERAQSVLQKMAQYGIGEPKFLVLVDGFGQEVPVASNASQQGRDKNRRVEVWLRK
ncbi:MAG: hypothetical protein QG657_3936 [Acidobacteriota bacterium]|nr:hypothetical protein [Acidobacteriota bacterium]